MSELLGNFCKKSAIFEQLLTLYLTASEGIWNILRLSLYDRNIKPFAWRYLAQRLPCNCSFALYIPQLSSAPDVHWMVE